MGYFLPIQTSLWPFMTNLILSSLLMNLVLWFNSIVSFFYVLLSSILLILLILLWAKDLNRESMLGYHTHKLELSMRMGMLLFILSEVLFFFSFFWAFFDASLSPSVELGMQWPPLGLTPLNSYSVPLLNTIILLSSGISITWAHHALMNNFYGKTLLALVSTIMLGVYFLIMQWIEYKEAQFCFQDGVFGSTFFLATGFHGMHVMLGTCLLIYSLVCIFNMQMTFNHHFMFELSAWYWHFVDVVWLFLYLNIYIWSTL